MCWEVVVPSRYKFHKALRKVQAKSYDWDEEKRRQITKNLENAMVGILQHAPGDDCMVTNPLASYCLYLAHTILNSLCILWTSLLRAGYCNCLCV